jgi:hypothetical protein
MGMGSRVMMKNFTRLLALTAPIWWSFPALAQNATLRLVASGTQVQQGQDVTIEVFLENLPRGVRGYQLDFAILPLTGATGTLSLADPHDPAQPGGDPSPNTSLFIDQTRPNWVFAPPIPSPTVTAVNVANLREVAALFSGTVGPFGSQRYCGTIILRASASALGNFSVTLEGATNATGAATYLTGAGGSTDFIPVTVVPVTIQAIPPIIVPPNDNCPNALTLLDGVTPFSTANATSAGPALPTSCQDGTDTNLNQDIWYNYTASCSGVVTVSTCNDASFDSRIAVYDLPGGTCSCPASATDTVIACDDNTTGCSGNTSQVGFTAVAGRCYKVRIGGFGTATGTGNLAVSCTANDTCAAATAISSSATVNGSTVNTNPESGLPACGLFGSSTVSGGVWYTTTGTGGLMTASLCTGTSYNSHLSVFSGACGSLACVAGVNNTCGQNESISWCSTAGTTYKILVHGATGLSGAFRLQTTTDSCADTNACTNVDACSSTGPATAVCVHNDTVTQPGQCCNPTTGARLPINDNNPCTTDSCNTATGAVANTPIANGPNVACDDTLRCTLDQCVSGNCVNTDINTISCTVPANCPAGSGSACVSGLCRCIENPTLDLLAQPGSLPVDTCYSVNDEITVRVEMGFAPTPIISAQMFLEYDASTLQFMSMVPGRTVDPTSPFNFPLSPPINNPTLGTLDYAVAVGPGGGGGTALPALVAQITFRAISECEPFVRFRPHTPPTLLLDAMAVSYTPVTTDLSSLVAINGTAPVLNACPLGYLRPFDVGEYSAVVDYPPPLAVDSCDGALTVTCDPPSGTAFDSGSTMVTCSALNNCGVEETCTFGVTVIPSTLTVDVELSPTIMPGTRQRCVTFDLWDCANNRHEVVQKTVTFSGGLATAVNLEVPGGTWTCIMARDNLHTLRSRAPNLGTTPDFINYSALFRGDPVSGGSWLVGGNLNDDGFIDIQDYVRFLQQYLMAASTNTACGTLPYHADINGSGAVDVGDLSFIQVSMFELADSPCCGPAIASEEEAAEPKDSISLAELREMGLGHLVVADMNGDEILDVNDIESFLAEQPEFEQLKREDVRPSVADPVDEIPTEKNRGTDAGRPLRRP